MLQVYLVRHGETQWNAERRIQGQSDSPLTAKGEQQAMQVATRAKELGITHIISSDLGRTRRTAEIIAQACGCDIIFDSRLRELNMGVLEKRHIDSLTEEEENRLQELGDKFENQIPSEEKITEMEKEQERFAKLSGGVAVIRVGAATETEMKEAKLRMEDALNATRAAVEEGIIAGGGSAYIHASKKVAELADSLEGDEKTGAKVILKALEAPLYYIAANAGLEGAVIINKVKESAPGTGFNAATEEYVDMVESGILDPVKVTRSALQNATSVASTLLTTESAVANIKEDTPAMPAGGAPGMGGMM